MSEPKNSVPSQVVWILVFCTGVACLSLGATVILYFNIPRGESMANMESRLRDLEARQRMATAPKAVDTKTVTTDGSGQKSEIASPPPYQLVSWRESLKHVGENCSVYGTIVGSRNVGGTCFFNFSDNWQTDFTAVIFKEDLAKFPKNPEAFYKGKIVLVSGTIERYKAKPEIVLRDQSQIVILDDQER